MTPCWSAPCAPWPTSWATQAAWSTSTCRSSLTEIVKQINWAKRLPDADGKQRHRDGRPPRRQPQLQALSSLGDGYADLAKAGKGLVEVEINGERFMANVYPDEQLGWTFIGLIRKAK
jgi:hypothetical protein